MSVIETTRFRLLPGGDQAAFLEADFRLQTEFIPNHPGFMRRTLAHDETGNWITVVPWGSLAEAEASADRWTSDAAATAFLAMLEPSSMEVSRYSTLD